MKARAVPLLIWTGRGYVVPLVTFACLLASEVATEHAVGDDTYFQEHGWPVALAFVVAGLAVAVLARRYDRRLPRVRADPAAGERVSVESRSDTFFFAPLRVWPHVLFAAAVFAAFTIG
ncbi:hypothetical protein [Rubrivirga sp.]|uniref:hypothetical protein n=1 Tax=Rubrivirga sp. TaxID=1885344 RepID=UPI003B52681F